jgi:hypothetical protein
MTGHILKMLWNQRRSHYGIFTEQLLVTVILMLAIVSLSETVKKYKTPGMPDVENTFSVGYMFGADVPQEVKENTQQSMDVLLENLKKWSCVKAVTRGFMMAPYLRNDHFYTQMSSDSIRIDDKQFLAVLKFSDEFGASVLDVEMEEGAWMENKALPDGSVPVVITRQFADKAGWLTSTGKQITYMSNVHTVTGVAAGMKQEPFVPSPVAMVLPRYVNPNNAMISENMVKIKPGSESEFIDAYNKEFERLISNKDYMIEPLLSNLQSLKNVWVTFSILGIVLQGIPTIFLFIFAFIGTFGLYWMTSRKRMKEFALRLAIGSAKRQLMFLVIGESLLITAIAIFPALALSFFIYEYTAVHVIAISITVAVMLLFSVISAWYPAWKVSRVNPAEALQYE